MNEKVSGRMSDWRAGWNHWEFADHAQYVGFCDAGDGFIEEVAELEAALALAQGQAARVCTVCGGTGQVWGPDPDDGIENPQPLPYPCCACELGKATAMIERLVAERDEARRQAVWGERLREAVTALNWFPSGRWLEAARFACQHGDQILGGRCARIAAALEAEESTLRPEALDRLAADVLPQEPESPCPHEGAEWRSSRAGYAEGWWYHAKFFGKGSENCLDCNKPLPPKPARCLTWEETAERLPGQFTCKRRSECEFTGYAERADGTWTGDIDADNELDVRRALVAAVEEGVTNE